MPEENRVFDVSRPSKVSPPPTSKPVIVGHHPMNDPMVTGDNNFGGETSASHMKIPVFSDGDNTAGGVTVEQAMVAHQAAPDTAAHTEEPSSDSPAIFSDQEENQPLSPPIVTPDPEQPSDNAGDGPFTTIGPDHPAQPQSELPPPAPMHEPDIEGLHFAQPKPKKGKLKWVIIGILALLIAVYLAIDAGVFGSGINLPFHVFKHEKPATETPAATTTNNNPAPSTPSVPAGYKEYKLADTNITFAAPTAWGDPTSTTDPGYAQRGGTNKPTGNYAYLVNFSVNKNIQIAVTSSKYLPAARAPLYYDYLQWCTGTNDNKTYLSVLNFLTENKVDTPTTVTCNQGPVTASPIDSSTIVQTKVTDTSGKVIGDVYTMNLNDPSLVVFRVKDAAMTNGTDIKQLLTTVQDSAAPAASSPAQ